MHNDKDHAAQLNEEQRTVDRVRRFNAALDSLMQFYNDDSLSVSAFFQEVTRETSFLLDVQRVSIWSFTDGQADIYCEKIFFLDSGGYSEGAKLSGKDFPVYFAAIQNQRVIDASDAFTDRRTYEFSEVYSKPYSIESLLDAQIRSTDGVRGIVCAESVSVKREWTPDEIAFIASIAEIVGFFLDRRERQSVHSQLERVNTRLEQAMIEVKVANERYNLAMDAAFDGVWDWDLKTGQVYFTAQNLVLLGENTDDMPSDFTGTLDWWQSRVHPDDLDDVVAAVQRHFESGEKYHAMYRIRHVNGTWRWWRSRGEAVRNTNGKPIRFVGTNSDVSCLIYAQQEVETRNQELEEAKQRIEQTALHDPLTGLPNRRYMDDVLDEALDAAKHRQHDIAFVHIDLDHFKEINDTLGHAAGDSVLRHVAQVLNTLMPDYFVARIGGDEFVAVIPDPEGFQPWHLLSRQLITVLEDPIYYESQPCKTGASIGIATMEDLESDAHQILANADMALYRAKNKGRNRVEIYSQRMREQAVRKRQLHEDILLGLQRGEFIPYFQPQFCALTQALAGVEALVRWHHPTHGVLAPPDFLKAADSLNCVADIDKIVLEHSTAELKRWQAAGLTVPRLSVNVSSSRISDPRLVESVKALDINDCTLCFELLESIFLDKTDDLVTKNLCELKKLGVQIEVDDFGTGYASIASLINIKPRRLKIDGSLVMDIANDQKMSSLVRSIVDMAKTLDIDVVAEGIETPKQSDMLTKIGCHVLQGFFLGRPVSSDAFLAQFSPDACSA